MKISLIQISDIHIRNDKSDFIFSKLESLKNIVINTTRTSDYVFLLIVGDIAFSGTNEQFTKSLDLLNALYTAIPDANRVDIIFVPGNHDCNFNINKEERDYFLENLTDDITKLPSFILDALCKPLEAYYEFIDLFEPNHKPKVYRDKLFEQRVYNLEGFEIVFNCLNTSWLSQIHENPSSLKFPIEVYEEKFKYKSHVAITLFHHPLHWIESNNKRDIEDILLPNSDLVFSGHEHSDSEKQINFLNEEETLYFEGTALQTNNSNESGFSIIDINLVENRLNKCHYLWNPSKSIYVLNKEIKDNPIRLAKTKNRRSMTLIDDFYNWLLDAGIQIKHPATTKTISLNELFIYPDVEIINYLTSESIDKMVRKNLKDVLFDVENNKIFMLGQEIYGKTTICKIAYIEYYKLGFIPIFIEGNAIKQASKEEIERLIKKHFSQQYGEGNLDEFVQQPRDSIVVIIDNFDLSKLSAKYKATFIDNLNSLYDKILITASELQQFEEILNPELYSQQEDYLNLKILPLGNKRRLELIEKWNNIGDYLYSDEQNKVHRIQKGVTLTKEIIGNNFVPSIPFFILTILQTIESDETNIKDSAYGHYYEYLIKSQLMTIRLDNEDLDAFYNYISYLAYHCFANSLTFLSHRELSEFHVSYNEKYKLNSNLSDNINLLLSSSIIRKYGSEYQFKYKYIYYYFVAKYLTDKLIQADDDIEEIEEIIKKMCNTLYNEENSNIVMFLSHLSKHKLILNSVLENARNIFKSIDITKLEQDIEPLNALISDIPKFVLENRGILEERKKRSEIEDQVAEEYADMTVNPSSTEVGEDIKEEFDLVANINWALKTLEIMGKILKNYYGSINAVKRVEITEEVYYLSLRSLNIFLTNFIENKESIIELLQNSLKDTEKFSDEKLEQSAARLLFNVITTITEFFISKVSDSAGNSKIGDTFEEALKNNLYLSVKLIDVAIKLNHGHNIPFKDIEEMLPEIKTNYLVRTLLSKIVIDYIYMFPIEYKDRQRISALLEFDDKRSKRISLKREIITK